jgi:hypothetical protein
MKFRFSARHSFVSGENQLASIPLCNLAHPIKQLRDGDNAMGNRVNVGLRDAPGNPPPPIQLGPRVLCGIEHEQSLRRTGNPVCQIIRTTHLFLEPAVAIRNRRNSG